jgi:peroxiredoxin
MTSPPAPASDTESPFASGPEVGTPLPDFTLPDQYGMPVTLHEARGADRALVVFIRATEW